MKTAIAVFLIVALLALAPTFAEAERIYMCRDALGKATFQQALCSPGQTEAFRGDYARNLPLKDVRERQRRLRRAVGSRPIVRRNAQR